MKTRLCDGCGAEILPRDDLRLIVDSQHLEVPAPTTRAAAEEKTFRVDVTVGVLDSRAGWDIDGDLCRRCKIALLKGAVAELTGGDGS